MQLENKKKELEEVRDHQKKLLQLQDKTTRNLRATENLEIQLDKKSKLLSSSESERDKLEQDLANSKGELAGIKRILGKNFIGPRIKTKFRRQ